MHRVSRNNRIFVKKILIISNWVSRVSNSILQNEITKNNFCLFRKTWIINIFGDVEIEKSLSANIGGAY